MKRGWLPFLLLVLTVAASSFAQDKDEVKELEVSEFLKELSDRNYRLSILFSNGKDQESELYLWEKGKVNTLSPPTSVCPLIAHHRKALRSLDNHCPPI